MTKEELDQYIKDNYEECKTNFGLRVTDTIDGVVVEYPMPVYLLFRESIEKEFIKSKKKIK